MYCTFRRGAFKRPRPLAFVCEWHPPVENEIEDKDAAFQTVRATRKEVRNISYCNCRRSVSQRSANPAEKEERKPQILLSKEKPREVFGEAQSSPKEKPLELTSV
ncbi:unnamed protein product [Haemonchus placei]|uniref:Leucine-rich repeat-containing protein 1 n=1 Tax=Haemonchus placei TaxID=6290 RepID=A0A158QNQ8_HAEPC|nr:unnamed protein product [Haemonchus placei]